MKIEAEDNAAISVNDVSSQWVSTRSLYQHGRSPAFDAITMMIIVDAPSKGSRTVAELAKATGHHASSYWPWCVLVRIGVFVEPGGQHFTSSVHSQWLGTNVSGSVSTITAISSWLADGGFWGLVHGVQAGQPGCQRACGMPTWRYLTVHNATAVAELVAALDRDDEPAYALGVKMLVAFGGKECAVADVAAVSDASGIQLTGILPTALMHCLIEGIPQGNGQDSS
jgi:hypothetical protein